MDKELLFEIKKINSKTVNDLMMSIDEVEISDFKVYSTSGLNLMIKDYKNKAVYLNSEGVGFGKLRNILNTKYYNISTMSERYIMVENIVKIVDIDDKIVRIYLEGNNLILEEIKE